MAQEVRSKYDELMNLFSKHFPKVDKKLLLTLLERLRDNPKRLPMFTVEVFCKPGTDPNKASRMIMSKTGKVPAVYDKGTHYVTDQQLSIEILEEISADPDVTSITGDPFTGGSRGPSHD
jgi:hypothetical protein